MTDAEIVAYNWGRDNPGATAFEHQVAARLSLALATRGDHGESAACTRLGLPTFTAWAQRGAADAHLFR